MKQNLKDIGVILNEPICIMCDNTSAINISKILVQHSRTNHISIWYHFLRKKVLDNKVKLDYVPTKEQIANIFMKALCKDTFEYLRQNLVVLPLPSLN